MGGGGLHWSATPRLRQLMQGNGGTQRCLRRTAGGEEGGLVSGLRLHTSLSHAYAHVGTHSIRSNSASFCESWASSLCQQEEEEVVVYSASQTLCQAQSQAQMVQLRLRGLRLRCRSPAMIFASTLERRPPQLPVLKQEKWTQRQRGTT